MPELHPSVAVAIVTGLVGLAVWIGKVSEHRSTVAKFMVEVRDKLDRVFERLPTPLVSSGSPLRLTELGKEISGELDARQWAELAATTVSEDIREQAPYDVQKFCFEHVEKDIFDEDLRTAIKTSAYDHGVQASDILRVFAIELRDILLGGRDPSESSTRVPQREDRSER